MNTWVLYQGSQTLTRPSQPRAGMQVQKRESNQTPGWSEQAPRNTADGSQTTTIGITRGRSIRFRIAYHAWRAGQEQDPTVATALVLTGFSMPPTVEFNGAVRTDLVTRVFHGDRAYLIPLQVTMKSQSDMEKALAE